MKKPNIPNINLEFLEPVFQNMEKLTKVQRISICCAAFILLVGVFVWLSYMPKIKKIGKLNEEFKTVQTQLATAQRNAAQLSMYRNKRAEAEAKLTEASKALPEKQEIPSLLTNISKSGQDAGLEFLLFQPKPEVPKEFYAEIPLSIKVLGNYHAVALFFDKVSKLSRIVNIQDIKMMGQKNSNSLETSCTAVTYKFIEEETDKKK